MFELGIIVYGSRLKDNRFTDWSIKHIKDTAAKGPRREPYCLNSRIGFITSNKVEVNFLFLLFIIIDFVKEQEYNHKHETSLAKLLGR